MSAISTSIRLLLTGALLCCAPNAFAQSADDRAYDLATEGAELFEKGQFRDAAKKFEEAYSFVKDSVLLKNQVVSLYKAGDCPVALDLAYTYDISFRDAPAQDKEDVRKVRIDCNLMAADTAIGYGKLDVATQSLDQASAIGLQGDEQARHDALRAKIEVKRGADTLTPDPVVEPSNTSDSWKPVAGWALLGTGAVVAGVSGFLHAGDRSRYEELDCQNRMCSIDEINESNDLADGEFVWVIGYGVGGAMILGGAGLLIHHYMVDGDSDVAVIPQIGPGSAGAAFHMRF